MKDDSWINKIGSSPKIKKWSQAGEEGYIDFILSHIGYGDKFLVDIGASDGKSNSNTRYFRMEKGYNSILIDGKNFGNPEIKNLWVTRDNIIETLRSYSCPKKFSFLSLDLDGNDYYILKEVITEYQPDLVVCEINGTIPIEFSKTIRYNPDHKYSGDDFYGFSFSAGVKLAEMTGYKVIFQNDALNLYMLRKDLLVDPNAEIKVDFQHYPYHAHRPDADWEEI